VNRLLESGDVKFVHAADLHIDSPMRGLDRYEGAPEARLRGATRRALENLVTLCIDERARFLLLAGDVFDGSWKDFSTGLFFSAQMARLREAGIAVVLVRGNHDAASAITKVLRLPDNVRELSPLKPQTIELCDGEVYVHGQSFNQRVTTEDLAARYPDGERGAFHIGLLHTCLDGREGYEPYAPTTLDVLRAKGYQYWALGHIHTREVLSTEPWVVFPGNLQGRHTREVGPKGATLVTADDGVVTAVEPCALDVVRWDVVTVDATSASDALDVVDLACAELAARAAKAQGRLLVARVLVCGTTRANASIRRDTGRFVSELRAAATDSVGDGVWIEKVGIETRSTFDLARIRQEPTAVGYLARRLEAIRGDAGELEELASVFADLDKKLPADLREGDSPLRLSDPASVRALLEDVEAMLLSRLLEDTE